MKSGVAFRGLAPLLPRDPPQCGSYRLHGRGGWRAGGMGQVYPAFLPGGRPAALKCVYPNWHRTGSSAVGSRPRCRLRSESTACTSPR